MTYDINASHHQHELEHEAEHERLVCLARAGTATSPLSGAREALDFGIVELGLALAGSGARRRTDERPGPHSIAI
jgi:hypothetical protein